MQSVLIPAPITLLIIVGVFVVGVVVVALGMTVGSKTTRTRLRQAGIFIAAAGVPITLVMALSGPRTVDDEAVIDNIEHAYSVSGVEFVDGGYTTDTIDMPAGVDSPVLHGYHGDESVEFVVGFTGNTPTSIVVVGESGVTTEDLVR